MDFLTPDSTLITIPSKFPSLKIVGTDGNAFSLMGRAQGHNNKHKMYTREEMNVIMKEAMAGDYDHLLRTLMYFFKAK